MRLHAAWDALPGFGRAAGATIVLFAVLALVGCDSAHIVDGWEVDGVAGCADTPFGGDNTVPCDVQAREIVSVATARLDQRDPGHAAVVRAQIHGFASRNGAGATGATVVVVFDLADGGPKAIGVGHPFVDAGEEHNPDWVAFDYGPMVPTKSSMGSKLLGTRCTRPCPHAAASAILRTTPGSSARTAIAAHGP